jgi:hypothetical protein
MPKFLIRLEDTDPASKEYRLQSMIAANEEEVRANLEIFEARHVAFTLSEEEVDELQRRADLTRAEQGLLHRHFQAEPYRIVSIQQVKGS